MTIFISKLKNSAVLFSIFIVLALCFKAVFAGTFGHIGVDNDDVMRLLQLRDLMGGQSWFDVTQTRMGSEAGTLMQWSRLVDLPILLLISLFDLFLPYAQAESLAISLWPPLCSLLFIWGILVGVKHMSGENWRVSRRFAFVLLTFLLLLHPRFMPGSIDHHNLQISLLSICIGYALDPKLSRRSAVISGIALAVAVGVGAEINGFVVVICAFFALIWLWRGAEVQNGVTGFGAAFAMTLAAIYFSTIAPEHYGRVYCDAFSYIMFAAGGAGGLGLAGLSFFMSAESFQKRFIGLGFLGVICAAIFILQAPQCFSNPLSSLPPAVKELWLGNIMEARGLFSDKSEWLYMPPYAIGTTCVALGVLCFQMWKKDVTAQTLFLTALLGVGLLFTIYQVRFHVFGTVIAIFVLAPWIGRIFNRERSSKAETSMGYIFALAVSMPIIWGFPAVFLKKEPTEIAGAPSPKACYSDVVLNALSKLEPGMVIATDNGTPSILSKTKHRVLAGNYHRNSDGILASIEIYTSDVNKAKNKLENVEATYFHLCRTTKESTVLSDYAPKGLMADMLKGKVPGYLAPIGDDLENGAVTLYKFVP